VKQIFVMAGQNLEIGKLTTNDGDLRVPPAHITHAVLHSEHARQRRNIELGLEVICRFRRVGILEED